MRNRRSMLIWLISLVISCAIVLPLGAAVASAGEGKLAATAAEEHGETSGEEAGHGEEDPGAAMVAEFEQKPIIALPKIGPVDLSITKAVLYMFMAGGLCIGWAIWQARRMNVRPDKKQTFTEVIYELVHDHIAKASLGDKLFVSYMPYVAALFLFIWVNNLISFIPLPFGAHSALGEAGGPHIPDLALYAATSNINVTIALAVMSIGLVHYLGIRHQGPIGYFKSWAPKGSLAVQLFMWPIHAIGEIVKPVSLSVRLFANMLTGHMLILVMFTIIFVVGSPFVGIATVPVAVAFYLFEVGLVATLQAYIFAVLSGVYMGTAVEAEH